MFHSISDTLIHRRYPCVHMRHRSKLNTSNTFMSVFIDNIGSNSNGITDSNMTFKLKGTLSKVITGLCILCRPLKKKLHIFTIFTGLGLVPACIAETLLQINAINYTSRPSKFLIISKSLQFIEVFEI